MSAPAPGARRRTGPGTERQAPSRAPLDTAEALSRWVRQGGTQSPSGAYCGWRNRDSEELSPPYPEITGYTLGFLSWLWPLDDADAARAAAGCAWLASRSEAKDFSARPEKTGRAVYTFDLAMAAHGLIRYGLAADDDRAVSAGLRNAEALVAAEQSHGSLPCVVPGTADGPLEESWSTQGHAHLLKCVQALLSAASLGLEPAAALAERLIKDTLDRQENVLGAVLDGCRSGSRTSLHALCYAAEGLWVWGAHHADPAATDLSRHITEWVWRHRLPEGGFPGFVPVRGRTTTRPVRQSDVLAQALRLAALHRLPAPGLERTVTVLLESVHRQGDTAAVCYWPQADEPHLNCWASLFAVQALRLHADGRHTLRWFELV
ncbi:hypothetical protein [Streptomyces varsoviensis]|uniref:Uncharacterized protein n=1 Tax=Streptomyces varsoviensis TaxID=67373 RepID=A0ABR5IT41_9ACTN|nr:hypothetical protein [Streptomyces varsoviensis]KOG58323.1 hypothetical protein ADK38_42880 [Streptomyces varsoviensis]